MARPAGTFSSLALILFLVGIYVVRGLKEAHAASEPGELVSENAVGVSAEGRRLVDNEDVIQRQGLGLCSLISATNIEALRKANDLVGWRCAYDAKVGAYLPIEDDKVTVCGNYYYNCNSTAVGTEGCSGKNITTERWTGVNCSEPINRFSLKNLVTTIDLNNRQLTGTIPPEIGYLSGLKELDLSQNQLTGSIHTDWMCDSLFELSMLRLDDNSLSNSIPHCIGNLTQLADLRLSNNQLTSVVPYSVANLTLLTELDLSNNLLTGSFPLAVFYMPRMTSIKAHDNLLTVLPNMGNGDPAETPGGWGGNIDYLTYLDFSNNQIASNILAEGTWSVWMPQLITLYLYNNQMTGNINSTISDFYKLEDLRAYSNSLTGPIPDTVGAMTRLTTLMLDSNSLTSSIPDHIGLATALQTLTLSDNSLTDIIPMNISYLTNLVTLDLSENQLTGTIHFDSFGREWTVPVNTFPLKQLEVLYLHDNLLTGSWPQMGHLTSLTHFDLSRNNFYQKQLPHDLLGMNCTNLEEFICIRCNITGTLPDFEGSLGQLTKLQKLDLSHNAITGTIPASITNQSLLNYFTMDRNNLTGSIPDELFHLEHLSHVQLGWNTLTGTIPHSPLSPAYSVPWIPPYGSVTTSRLVSLELTDNQLTGSVPETLYTSNTNLVTIKLGTNALTGTVSTSLWTLTRLSTVWMSDNNFNGGFPSGFSDTATPALSSVMFANAGLTGAIPNIFTLHSLTEIDLSNSDLTGTVSSLLLTGADDEIPNAVTIMRFSGMTAGGGCGYVDLPDFQYHTSLVELDLSGNKYGNQYGNGSGLPDEMKLLTRLTKLDLSDNYLAGAVESDFFDNMEDLEYLDMSGNSLSGAFPWTSLISNTASTLYYLKLNDNSFTGNVPASLGSSVTNMRQLYLGGNSFSGPIPTSLTSMTLLDVLDITNNQFTGDLGGYTALANFNMLRVFNIGGQNFDADTEMATATWLNTLNQNGYMRTMDISGTRLTDRLPNIFLSYATKLNYLDVSDNALTGTIAGDSVMTNMVGLRTFIFDNNALTGRLDADLCAIPNIASVKAFPGNLNIECYPACLTSLLDVTTNANGVTTCAPTALPTFSPTASPTASPTVGPTAVPSSAPSYFYYDGKFVQTGEYHWSNFSQARNETQCLGELEVRSVYPGHTYEESLGSNLTEVWCVERRNYDEWRFFGEDELFQDLKIKNDLGSPYPKSGTLLNRPTLHSAVYRGKQYNTSINFVTQSWDSVKVPSGSAFSDGGCGDSCAFTALDFGIGDNSSEYVWEDALLACPYMGETGHGMRKILPIAREDGWPYGSSAMLQKVRLTDIQPSGLDSSAATAESVDADIASLFRTGTTQLVGAYLMVKGAVIGGRDRLSIQNARRGWRENSTTCSDSVDDQYEYAYDYSADLDAYTPTMQENVTISHDTHSWATVDITDMTRNQLVWWYLNHPSEAFELNLLWTPLNYTMDRTYGFPHYYYRPSGDVVGDTDRMHNMTTGRTEWYTSESADPPILLLYFQ